MKKIYGKTILVSAAIALIISGCSSVKKTNLSGCCSSTCDGNHAGMSQLNLRYHILAQPKSEKTCKPVMWY